MTPIFVQSSKKIESLNIWVWCIFGHFRVEYIRLCWFHTSDVIFHAFHFCSRCKSIRSTTIICGILDIWTGCLLLAIVCSLCIGHHGQYFESSWHDRSITKYSYSLRIECHYHANNIYTELHSIQTNRDTAIVQKNMFKISYIFT